MSTRSSDPSPQETAGLSTAAAPVDVTDLIDESVAVFGLDMLVRAWNAEAERLYGWKREEVIGGRIQACVKCAPSQPLSAILAQVRETGSWRGEFVRATKGGSTVVVKAKWSLRRDATGTMLDIVETSRDITEVRRTEEALNRVRGQYRNLFQASVASFWELDFTGVVGMVGELLTSGVGDLRGYFQSNLDYVRQMIRTTRIADVNEQSVAMFGNGNREELLRSLDPLWPDESLEVFAECVLSAFEKREHYSAEAVICSLDGRRFDTLFTVSYPPELLESARLLIGVVDMTQAKKARAAQEASERRYRDFFHFLPVPLLRLESQAVVDIFNKARSEGVVDFSEHLKGRPDLLADILEGYKIVEVNRRTVEMLRGQSAEEFTGSITWYWTESLDVFRDVMGARYAGKPGFEGQVKMVAHDGTILDALFFAAFGPITGAQHISLVGLIDVSDRVKAQEMLARVQAEMAHAARVSVLGELTASIAHEVSQPLTAIETNTEASRLWLERTPPNLEEIRELSAQTAAEVQRAADIIHRIRSMALRASPEHTSIEANTVITEAMLFLRHELQRNEVDSSLQLGSDLPNIFGDRVQLQQVIVNLVVNAMQAMTQAASRPREVAIQTSVAAEGVVLITVEDTGPGIADEALERLFESFFTTKTTGMGMGLPICRSIIEAHGGSITAENRSDRPGARFVIHLPTPQGRIKAPNASIRHSPAAISHGAAGCRALDIARLIGRDCAHLLV
jgi:PAS domain S-box-containing protein